VQEYVLSELDSGERLITERVDSVRSVSLGFWIGAGARDEPDAKAGVSHFIEHLLFKGTRSYEAQRIAEIFDEMGGELNAATSREHTVVYARVPDRHLEDALDVMADMVFSPAFTDIDSEREVVLEEIAMVEDAPQDLVHDLLSEAVFSEHPLGRPVIGRAEVISSISRRSISAYHRRAYVAGNVVLAAAGHLEHDRLLGLLERAARGRAEPPARDTRVRFAASLLDAILGGSASSRLFQEIREKRGMAYTVYSFGSQYTDSGLIGIYVGTREENLVSCLEIVAEEIADIAAGNLRERELERAKENLKGRIALSMESTSNRMSRLGRSLITDTELLSLDRVIAEIDAVEPAALAELAGVLLEPERVSAAGIGPNDERFAEAVERIHPGLAAAA
jgi:predicted Zn-dependent peptidase